MGGKRKRIKQERRERNEQARIPESAEEILEQPIKLYPDLRGKTLKQHLKHCRADLEDWTSPYGMLVMRCDCGIKFGLHDVVPLNCPGQKDCLIEDLRKPETIQNQAQKNREATGYAARVNASSLRKLRRY